jgi:hypothetical protein
MTSVQFDMAQSDLQCTVLAATRQEMTGNRVSAPASKSRQTEICLGCRYFTHFLGIKGAGHGQILGRRVLW